MEKLASDWELKRRRPGERPAMPPPLAGPQRM
jgi:hypothetical protein